MSISAKDIKYIANLARLAIDSEKIDFYVEQLNPVLQLVNQMNNIDTSHIEPMAHPQNFTLRLREDEITEKNLRDDYQAIAPETEDGLYLVPRVIEEHSQEK